MSLDDLSDLDDGVFLIAGVRVQFPVRPSGRIVGEVADENGGFSPLALQPAEVLEGFRAVGLWPVPQAPDEVRRLAERAEIAETFARRSRGRCPVCDGFRLDTFRKGAPAFAFVTTLPMDQRGLEVRTALGTCGRHTAQVVRALGEPGEVE